MISLLKKIRLTVLHAITHWRILIKSKRKPVKLVIGASSVYQAGWLDTDEGHLNLLVPGDWNRYFRADSLDAILAEHVWEHLSEEDGFKAAKNCFHYLKPGGYMRVAVPDGFHPSPEYVQQVKPGGTGMGADDHRVLYNYKSLSDLFTNAGFKVSLLEYFTEAGRFIRNPWDPKMGLIVRSSSYDERNKDGKLNYTSLILDAFKEEDCSRTGRDS